MTHEAQEEEEPVRDRVFCFLNASRPCDMECIAFLPSMPEGADYRGQPWSRCSLLVNAHRTGKHLTVLAQIGSDIMKHMHIKSADAKREANNPSATPKAG